MVQRRNSRQRELVLDAVQCLKCHPTANQVYAYVHEKDDHVSMGTVYRNLNLLAEAGIIRAVQAPGGNHSDFRTDDHNHVVCVKCGAMADADIAYDKGLDARVSACSGYDVKSHFTVFEGVCPSCQAQ